MNVADWVILVSCSLVSVVQAAREGFFHEAFGIGGLDRWVPVGRLAVSAAWQRGLRRM